MEIIQTLGESDGSLSFSELRDRVGVSDSGQFNYHLDKLVGHFVGDTEGGYELRRAGERIIEAVVSGAVTENPEIGPMSIDWPCQLCGASIIVSYRQEWLMLSCPDCSGLYDAEDADDPLPDEQREHGYLGGAALPPAGIEGRDPREVFLAAHGWSFLERIALSNGICPRCSGAVDRRLTACDNHQSGDELCDACGRRRPELWTAECPNCPLEVSGSLPSAVHGYPPVINFITAHDFNPVVPTEEQWVAMGEAFEVDIPSLEPLRARITYSLEGDELRLSVDDELNTVEVKRLRGSSPD